MKTNAASKIAAACVAGFALGMIGIVLVNISKDEAFKSSLNKSLQSFAQSTAKIAESYRGVAEKIEGSKRTADDAKQQVNKAWKDLEQKIIAQR